MRRDNRAFAAESPTALFHEKPPKPISVLPMPFSSRLRDCFFQVEPALGVARAPVRHLYTNTQGMLVNDDGVAAAAGGVGTAKPTR